MGRLLHPNGYEIQAVPDAHGQVAWLRAFLREHEVHPRPSSALESALHDVTRYWAHSGENFVPFTKRSEFAGVLRNSMGMLRLIGHLRSSSPQFRACCIPILSLFSGKDVALSRPGRNTKNRNIAWELVVGAAADRVSPGTTFDEPDIIWPQGSAVWGIACKVLYSRSPRTQGNALVKGAKQIERSRAELGMVFANATDLIDHDVIIGTGEQNTHRVWGHPREVERLLNAQLRGIAASLDQTDMVDRLRQNRSTGRRREKTRCVVLHASTIAWSGGAPVAVDSTLVFEFRPIHGSERRVATSIANRIQL